MISVGTDFCFRPDVLVAERAFPFRGDPYVVVPLFFQEYGVPTFSFSRPEFVFVSHFLLVVETLTL